MDIISLIAEFNALNLGSFFATASLVNGIVALAAGLAVARYVGNYPNPNRLFAAFMFSISLWSIGYFFWLSSSDIDEAIMWVRILNIGAALIPVLQYHYVLRAFKLWRRWTLPFGYIMAIFFAVVPFTSWGYLYIDGMDSIAGFRYWPHAGPLYILYIIFGYVLYFVLCIYELARLYYYRKKEQNVRGAARQLFFAISLASVSGLTNFPLWYGITVIPYGNLLMPAYIFIFLYIIYRYNLLGIKHALVTIAMTVVGAFLLVRVAIDFFIPESILTKVMVDFIMIASFFYFSQLARQMFISERYLHKKYKDLAKKLEEANERLRKLDKQKSEMLSIAAHQLRTPLTAMNGYISLIIEGDVGEALGSQTRIMLVKVSRAVMRLSLLVNNLLNMSRIDDERMQYAMRPMRVEGLLREAVEMFRVVAKDHQLTLELQLPDTPLPKIIGDEGKLHEVVVNLINNAIKYTKQGGIIVRAWVGGEEVYFSVKDTGVGLSREDASHLFQKFSRADHDGMNTEGAGLGLYVCYNIVHDHGGHIHVESDGPGKGTEFIVSLPLAATSPATSSSKDSSTS